MPVAPVPFPFGLATIPASTIITKAQMIKPPGTKVQNDAQWSLVIEQGGVTTWFQDAGNYEVDGDPPLMNIDSFVFGSHTPVNQHYVRTFTPADFPALAPNKIVRIDGIINWYRYTFAVAPVARVFVKINGFGLTNIPGTLTGAGSGPQPFNLVTAADGSGNLVVEFGIYLDDGVGSASIGATLLTMEVTSPAEDWSDILIDSAVLYHNGETPISITREGARFEERATFENWDYPGKAAPTDGGDEITGIAPALIVKFMNVGERQFGIYQPGGSWGSSEFDRTYQHSPLRTVIPSGSRLSDVRCIWKRLTGGYLQVRFPKAIVTSYGIGSADKNEGEIPVVIEARQDLSVAVLPKTTPLYYADRLPSSWTI
jgi:hypothetical protein